MGSVCAPCQVKFIITATSQVAVGSVARPIFGHRPLSVDHIPFAHEDGFGQARWPSADSMAK